jgi:hypothetical protein
MKYSLQSRLSKKQSKLKRRLWDNNLNNVGYSFKMLKLRIQEDMYQDENVEYIKFSFLTGLIQFPNNRVPLFTTENYDKGVSVYDLLPTKAYFKFEDNVEKGDLLILKYILNPDTSDYKLLVYQIVEHIGSFSNVLIFQEYNVAPFTLDIENYPTIRNEIENWQDEEIE